MEYLDFELRIGTGTASTYPIMVVRAPAGESSATTQLPLDNPAFKQHLQAVEQVRSLMAQTRTADATKRHVRVVDSSIIDELDIVETIGRALFDALMPVKVLACYRRSCDAARADGKRLRLRLRIEAPELAVLPWEFLFDADEGDYVSLNQDTPLTRYLELDRPQVALTIPPPIRILGMVASPHDLPALDVTQEQQRMAASIDHLVESRTVELTWLDGQTLQDLDAALRDSNREWHIFHFIGHGGFDRVRGEGLIALVDETDGNTSFLAARQLGRLFARQPSIRLIVLNACEGARASETKIFSSTGAVLAQRGVPAVVSMQYEITDRAALEFSRNFYDALARGLPVDAAVTEARYYISMKLPDSSEWGTPVLYMRAPDGNLFTLDIANAIFRGQAAPEAQPASQLAPQAHIVETPPAAATDTKRGLQILLRKVKQFWIEGVLEKSLFQKVLIDLGMERMQGAVDNPWTSVLDRPGASSQLLPPEQTIADVFAEEGSSLLLLGEPGSGKTTMMLELARVLLARSERDLNSPIPVIFNLSSWVEPQRTIIDWLVDELSTKYQIPKKIGRSWLRESRLLPLLDGLDELLPERRAACVKAINVFTQEAGLMGTLVCCRLREYIDLPIRLVLNAALRLQPFTDEQVHAYLTAAGGRLAALRTALQQDSALRIDARSPLMLNLMVRAYQDLTVEAVVSEGSETIAMRRKQLLDAYVGRMFRRAAQRRVA